MRIEHFDDIIDRIRYQDRAGFCGPTDSGKTRAMAEVLKHFDDVLLTSPKRKWDWELQPIDDPKAWERQQKRFSRRAYDLKELDRELNAVAREDSGDPVVFLPERMADRRLHHAVLDTPYRIALERGNTMTATDELYYHANGSNFESAAPWLYYTITGGRSDGVGSMYCFQRPVWVPKVALSETQHLIVFFLEEQDDRDTIDARAGKERGGKSPIDWETLRNEDHTFVYVTRRFVSEPLTLDLEKEAA